MKHAAFQELVERGIAEDRAISYLVDNEIATKDELKELVDIGVYSIENILNGRYYADAEPRVIELMQTWNDRLGFKFFLTV